MLSSTSFPPRQPAHSWPPGLACTPDAALSDLQDHPTCFSGGRARSRSGLEPWLWLPGFPSPRMCRQSSRRSTLRLLSCFRDTLKSRCPPCMQTGPCRGVQPFKWGDPQRSPLPDGSFASSAVSEPQIIFAKFPKCLCIGLEFSLHS